jgi:hypothetical protein
VIGCARSPRAPALGPRASRVLALAAILTALPGDLRPHAGPPFPIVHREQVRPYDISVWTDPDATDDGSAGGQFWVMVRLLDGSPVPADTRAVVAIRPLDRDGTAQAGTTEPVRGNVSRQFVALVMDHEGRFAVRTEISGSRGSAVVEAEVDATYDLRPPPITLAVYAMPFIVIGFFWLKILRQRRGKIRAPVKQV